MTTWLDPKATAQHMGLEPKTLANWRASKPEPKGPPFRRIGRLIRYDLAEVDRFIDTNGTAA